MKFTRRAKAQWNGSGKEGHGLLTTDSGILNNTKYSFKTRFEDGSKGTNPEELVGGSTLWLFCYATKLSPGRRRIYTGYFKCGCRCFI